MARRRKESQVWSFVVQLGDITRSYSGGETMQKGTEWLVDAAGCDADSLRCLDTVRGVCDSIVAELGLRPVGDASWHQFSGAAGVTGMYLLSESHLTCHTFPEYALASFNLFCCRPRPSWPWRERLSQQLAATEVNVRRVERLAAAFPVAAEAHGG